ncbi:MAG: hypothetical protein K9H26_00105 [Prolixibacteraceae bacterium]|nr:hypothetical protein [Prolixibacteraceae bacterium]
MKQNYLNYLFLFLLITGCNSFDYMNYPCRLKENPSTERMSQNVLFIGTNLTAENNLPRMVSKLAKSMGDTMFYLTYAPYDYDFQRCSSTPLVLKMIRDFKWDYIVLQESGWRVALPESMADTMVYRWADSLNYQIRQSNPEARIVLFMTHAFVDGVGAIDNNWALNDPDVATYKGMQHRIVDNVFTISERFESVIAPCGQLWNICMDMDSTLLLHFPDRINPNINGSYLSACTLYSALFRRRITEDAWCSVEIPDNRAAWFHEQVNSTLFDCNPDWTSYE